MKTHVLYKNAVLLPVFLLMISCEPSNPSEQAPGAPNQQTSNTSSGKSVLFEDVQTKYDVSPDVPDWTFSSWTNSDALSIDGLRGNVVVVRFWTNTCPYCARSMPALQRLKNTFDDRPVTFIGAYHSKPFGSERPWSSAVEKTRNWNVTFPVAYDRNWTTLRKWWLSTGDRDASSCTFVLNKNGRVTYIHPGPVYEPGDPNKSQAARDFQELQEAIKHALSQPGPASENSE